MRRRRAGSAAVAFERNLAVIADRLAAAGVTLVWASTTPVPEGREVRRAAALDAFLRVPASAVRLGDAEPRPGAPVQRLSANPGGVVRTGLLVRIEKALRSVPADGMPAGRVLAARANVPDRQRRDGARPPCGRENRRAGNPVTAATMPARRGG